MNAGGMLNTCKSDGKHGKWYFQWRTGFNPGQAVEITKLEYGGGRGNFWWSGEMRRDQKEHQWRNHSAGPTLKLRDES
ncbi:hypothetical protein BC332_32743 [Capsicum chinense]|nr:hypothetical protein BC332_32743 [Capsicum chinense]